MPVDVENAPHTVSLPEILKFAQHSSGEGTDITLGEIHEILQDDCGIGLSVVDNAIDIKDYVLCMYFESDSVTEKHDAFVDFQRTNHNTEQRTNSQEAPSKSPNDHDHSRAVSQSSQESSQGTPQTRTNNSSRVLVSPPDYIPVLDKDSRIGFPPTCSHSQLTVWSTRSPSAYRVI